MMIDDEMAKEDEQDSLTEEMMKKDKPMLASTLKTAQAYHDKLSVNKNLALANTERRIVSVASISSENSVTHDEMRGMMP